MHFSATGQFLIQKFKTPNRTMNIHVFRFFYHLEQNFFFYLYDMGFSLLTSHNDFCWIRDVFWKRKADGSADLDMERDHGFKFLIHDRDFIAGRTIRANIMDGIEKSRRAIFILSR